MKLLLTAINAKYIHSNLALHTFLAIAPDCSEHLLLNEYTINQTTDFILQDIYTAAPDVLFFSCYIWNIAYVETVTAELHKLLPDLPIWLGGPEVSFESEAFLAAHPAVTGIMRGEGEVSFCAVARRYIFGSPDFFSDIPGLVFRQGENILKTGMPTPLSLSQIPFAYAGISSSADTGSYPGHTGANTYDISGLEHRIVYYESSRGCPFRCSYCLSSLEKSLRFRDLRLVKKELSFFVEQKIPQVKFVDRTFNCNHEHALAILRHIKEIDRGTTNFHFEVSADLFREDELLLLEDFRPGLVQLEIGVQSTNPDTIAAIRRQMNLPRLMEVVRRIRSWNNIHLHLDLIAGLPFEGYDTFAKSFDDIFSLVPNQLQLGFLKVLRGSYMHEHAPEYGILYHDHAPYEVLATKWLDYGELLRIKRVEEMVEVYYNSAQYALTIRLLTLLFPSPFAFFQQLGDYYERNGLFGRSHSRLARCEILLAFFEEELAPDVYAKEDARGSCNSGKRLGSTRAAALAQADAPDSSAPPGARSASASDFADCPAQTCEMPDLLREALIYDLYARENCKKRPSWAADLTPYRNVLRTFPAGQKDRPQHIEIFHYRFPLTDAQALATFPERSERPLFYRFCYDRRDPLTYQAYIEETENILCQTSRYFV